MNRIAIVAGIALVAIPFVAASAAMVKIMDWKATALIWAVSLTGTALVLSGSWLLVWGLQS